VKITDIPSDVLENVRQGVVIPAHPLALNESRKFDTKHQRALTRYYIDAGAGGIAVGVHTTQFEIRKHGIDLFEPVLSFCSETVDNYCSKKGKTILKIAGVCGKTHQAVKEAQFAKDTGFHACLLSLAAMVREDIPAMIKHCYELSRIMPIMGFYLQTAVGGKILSYEFWRKFAEIENVLAIKIAPFNRYQTLDVVRAVCEAGREKDIALYTGNDDNIVTDLLTEYRINTTSGTKSVRIVGGLLGHWAVWTKKAVELLEEIHSITEKNISISREMLIKAIHVTDCNAVFFDAANRFAGCIPGIHEVLKRQRLLQGTWCLDPDAKLSPGQKEEIDRVYQAYPHLSDDVFVKKNLDSWLAD